MRVLAHSTLFFYLYNYTMRITLLTYGSLGDFQPFLALADGLQKAGHQPLLAGPGRFAPLAVRFGVPFVPLAGDPAVISARFNDAGSNVYRMVRSIRDYAFAIAPQVIQDARQALHGADYVVHSFLFTTGAHTFARQMGVPDLSVQTFPMFAPTRAFPNVALSGVQAGVASYFTHWLATQVFWYGGNSGYRSLRKQYPQDLPPKLYWPFTQYDNRPLTPLAFAYSTTVLPRPADWSSAHIHIPGYFFLDEPNYQPAPGLVKFLEAGEPPVCISFGSMLNRDEQRIRAVVLSALRATGLRGLLLTGWGGVQTVDHSTEIFEMESAPHAWLLPRCRAVLHHGGAGTTGAGLRAGIPNIVVPFAGDQPFWGRRVAALGAGPAPIPVKRLDVSNLSNALRMATSDPLMQKNAARLGEQVRAEQGIVDVIRLITS